jgi:hypothetical protein
MLQINKKRRKQKRSKPARASLGREGIGSIDGDFSRRILRICQLASEENRVISTVMYYCKSCGVICYLANSTCEKCTSDVDIDKAITNYFSVECSDTHFNTHLLVQDTDDNFISVSSIKIVAYLFAAFLFLFAAFVLLLFIILFNYIKMLSSDWLVYVICIG